MMTLAPIMAGEHRRVISRKFLLFIIDTVPLPGTFDAKIVGIIYITHRDSSSGVCSSAHDIHNTSSGSDVM